MPPIRSVCAVLALLALPTGAAAQGLVQLSLEGRVDLEAAGIARGKAGTHVEVEVGALVAGEPRKVELHLYLAHGTTAADLGSLVAKRLERAKFDVIATEPTTTGTPRGNVFIEDALYVNLRLGGGLTGAITTSEGAPASIKVERPGLGEEQAKLTLSGSTFSPHDKKRSAVSFELEIEATDHSPHISEALNEQGTKQGWLSERPAADSWRPMKLRTGEAFSGFSIRLDSPADWRIEVALQT
jgi:hypothetical protein